MSIGDLGALGAFLIACLALAHSIRTERGRSADSNPIGIGRPQARAREIYVRALNLRLRLQDLNHRMSNGRIGSGLAPFAALHLELKAEAGKVEASSIAMMELHLRSAVAFFGEERELDAIGVDDVQNWARHLARLPNRKGGKLSATSVRKYLNSLSNPYRRGGAEGYVTPGFNPVAGMVGKPSGVTREEAEWLEVDEMALFLEAAAHYTPARDHMRPIPPAQALALIAAFALTGGREAEVLGLAADDVRRDRARSARPHAIPHGISDAFDTTNDTAEHPSGQDAKTPPQ